jgi:glutamine synthetase
MTPKEAVKFAKDKKAVCVDLKFMDFLGTWQHFTIPMSEYSEALFEEGSGFDGSSIRGWQPINASDMLIVPEPASAVMDPFCAAPTLSLIGNVVDPITTGRDEGPNLGFKPRHKEGYFPVPPTDSQQDIRQEMVMMMEQVGILVEKQHHEVATAGQAEIDMRFAPLTKMADNLMWYKYCVKNVARKNGKTATFMPKPIFGDNGSGMHVHQSIWKGEKPLFAGNGYAGMSELAMHYIAGIIKHAPALAAITNPTANSYRRLVPGFEAPVNLAYSSRNRSAAIRIPMYSPSPKAKRIEVRFPDPTANGYLAFAAMLMAGLDGIENRLAAGDPLDKDIYSLTPEELKGVRGMPASLEEALNNLKNDHAFLLKGDVFTEDVIETWIDWKMSNEVSQMRLRPHPHEFNLYYDA